MNSSESQTYIFTLILNFFSLCTLMYDHIIQGKNIYLKVFIKLLQVSICSGDRVIYESNFHVLNL
jgi:hypothetical protein